MTKNDAWTIEVTAFGLSYKKIRKLFDMISVIAHHFHRDITVGLCPWEDPGE